MLQDLYGVGARKFSVVSTSLVGCCPSQRLIAHNLQDPKATDKYGCLAALNNLSSQLYPMFATMLQDLSGELPGMNYSLVDSIKMVEWVLENPSTPSFSNEHQAQLLPQKFLRLCSVTKISYRILRVRLPRNGPFCMRNGSGVIEINEETVRLGINPIQPNKA